MLEQVLGHLRNWFLMEVREDTYTVANGALYLPFLQDGQYFRVTGSVFNDGVYQYPARGLTDETFDGAVWSLAVPKALLDTVAEIEDWQAKHGERAAGPYASESFGGYSYTKATDAATGQGATWQTAFRCRLNVWRKI